MRAKDGDDFTFAIHEVYYDEGGNVTNWTRDPAGIISDTEDFTETMVMMTRCFMEPVLDYDTGKEIEEPAGEVHQ
jgi:hypothetical protein